MKTFKGRLLNSTRLLRLRGSVPTGFPGSRLSVEDTMLILWPNDLRTVDSKLSAGATTHRGVGIRLGTLVHYDVCPRCSHPASTSLLNGCLLLDGRKMDFRSH